MPFMPFSRRRRVLTVRALAASLVIGAVVWAAPASAQSPAPQSPPPQSPPVQSPPGPNAPLHNAPAEAPPQSAPQSTLPAETDEKLQKAELIFDLSLPLEQLSWMMRSVAPSLAAALRTEGARVGAEMAPDLDLRVQQIVNQELAVLAAEMRPQIAPIYASTLTDAELDKLIEIYGSPEGRAMMEKMPAIASAVGLAMSAAIEQFKTRVGDRIERDVLGVTPQ